MPRKPTTPKPLKMAINDANNGVQVFVGESRCPAVTLFPHHIAMAATRLGIKRADTELLAERDQARADHGAADVALQDTLKELEKANGKVAFLQKRACDLESQLAEWKQACDLEAVGYANAKRDLTTLQANFDALNDEFKAEKRARHNADLNHAAELHRAKALGWLFFGSMLVCGVLGFISLVLRGGR